MNACHVRQGETQQDGDVTFGTTVDIHSSSCNGHLVLPVETVLNGRYKIKEMLGHGGMGSVYRAADVLLDRDVALKTLQFAALAPERLALFKAEFAVLAGLSHPHVARVYDFEPVVGTDHALFTMEIIEGKNILSATENVSWRRVVDLLVQACKALAYMHGQDVVHFDIKPANILVQSDDTLKVLDFGLAGVRSMGAGLYGTPAYMAPEIILGRDDIDYRCDLYGLGVMAYQLLSRELPEPATTITGASAIGYRPIKLRRLSDHLPEWLKRLVGTLCSLHPADRPSSANKVISIINDACDTDYELQREEPNGSSLFATRFVGRRQELEALTSYVQSRLKGGSGRPAPLQVVTGSAGSGKSRLLKELRHHVQLQQQTFVQGDCYEAAFTEFGPWSQAAAALAPMACARGHRHVLARSGGDIIKLLPELAPWCDEVSSVPLDDPEAEEQRLLQAATELFIEIARISPYLLHLNDVHWARGGTLKLLKHLVHRVIQLEVRGEPVPLALVATLRDDKDCSELQSLETIANNQVVRVSSLNEQAAHEMLTSMLGEHALPAAVLSQVHQECRGNPYHMQEMLRALVSSGALFSSAGVWRMTVVSEAFQVPSSLANVLAERIANLSGQQLLLLETMSVISRPVGTAVLAAAAQLEQTSILSDVLHLERQQWIRRNAPDDLVFSLVHDGLRQTVYSQQDEAKRRRLHANFAFALVETPTSHKGVAAEETAYHFWKGRIADRALEFSLIAAKNARLAHANDLAAELYSRILDLAADCPNHGLNLREIRERLADALLMLGQFEAAMQHYDVLAADVANDAYQAARLMRKIALVSYQLGDIGQALEQYWDAAKTLGARRPGGRLALGFSLIGALAVHLFRGRIGHHLASKANQEKRARELSSLYLRMAYAYAFSDPLQMLHSALCALNVAERAGDSGELSHACSLIDYVYAGIGQFERAKRYGDKGIAIAKRRALPWHVAVNELHEAMRLMFMGHLEPACEQFAHTTAAFRRYGDVFELGASATHHAIALILLGRLQDAVIVAEDGLADMERTGAGLLVRTLVGALGFARGLQGKVRIAEADFDEVDKLSEKAGDKLTPRVNAMYRSSVALAAGKLAQTEEVLKAIAEDIPMVYTNGVPALLARAMLQRHLQGEQINRSYAHRMVRRGLRQTNVLRNYRPQALIAAALQASVKRRHTQAETYYAEAVALSGERKCPLFQADALLVGAVIAKAWHHTDQARQRLENARKLYIMCGSELGTAAVQQRALELEL